jgi:hypothetical protein
MKPLILPLWEAIRALSQEDAIHTKTPGSSDTISELSFCRRGLWNEQTEWEREIEAYERTEVQLCREGKVEMPC